MSRPFRRPSPLPVFLLTFLATLATGGCGEDPDASATGPTVPPATSILAAEMPIPGSYFPLHVGGRWIYVLEDPPEEIERHHEHQGGIRRMGDALVAEVAVAGVRAMGQRQVFDLGNYLFPFADDDVSFYEDAPGMTMELAKGESGLWYPWWQFDGERPVDIVLPDFATDCIHGSEGLFLGVPATTSVPAGTFHQTVTIYYHHRPCDETGIVSEVLAPEVGLIRRKVMTPQGPMTWSLAYAEVGGRRWGSLPEVD